MSEGRERKVIKYGEEPQGLPAEAAEEAQQAAAEVQAEAAQSEVAEAFEAPDVPDYFKEPDLPETTPVSGEELDAKIGERRSRIKAKQTRKKRLTVLAFVLAFAFLATMCGKDIVRLKAENVALKRQQVALQKERDELKAELESTSEQEYIRDQARRQLRLLNPGELLFIWDEDE